ncbi:MAG: OsmC family protein [Ignavibacteria bacterium]|nr:OsmC family protein [Ignavibacteria bacterium]
MRKTAKIEWAEGFKLKGITDTGKEVIMDSGTEAVAASPAQLVLQALAGCTMMDCYLIISKSRKKIDKFWVEVDAEEAEDHPKIFTKIHLTYNFYGSELNDELIKRVINLSETKYCRVHSMLSKSSEITSSYKLNK